MEMKIVLFVSSLCIWASEWFPTRETDTHIRQGKQSMKQTFDCWVMREEYLFSWTSRVCLFKHPTRTFHGKKKKSDNTTLPNVCSSLLIGFSNEALIACPLLQTHSYQMGLMQSAEVSQSVHGGPRQSCNTRLNVSCSTVSGIGIFFFTKPFPWENYTDAWTGWYNM